MPKSRQPKSPRPTMRQRSFRLTAETMDQLDRGAAERGESANALAQRLLDEGMRRERHPLIYFRTGEAGRRPALVGSRLDVARVIETLRAEGADVAATAELLGIAEARVRACVSYYAEFAGELDDWMAREDDAAEALRERLAREQQLLA